MIGIEAHPVDAVRRAQLDDRRSVATRLGHALSLAATPTFALMALLTGFSADAVPMLCSSEPVTFLSGMLPMYLSMSVFHSPPWLKLITRSAHRSNT